MTRTQAGESWDLWSVEDGRRVGFLSVVDDGHVVYALATVKRGTSHEEVADLVEGFFTPSSTDAHNREIIISDYDEEPEMLESDIRPELSARQAVRERACAERSPPRTPGRTQPEMALF